MTIDEMKAIAAQRTPGNWHCSTKSTDCDFVEMCNRNIDRLLAVAEVVKDHAHCEMCPEVIAALKALEEP